MASSAVDLYTCQNNVTRMLVIPDVRLAQQVLAVQAALVVQVPVPPSVRQAATLR